MGSSSCCQRFSSPVHIKIRETSDKERIQEIVVKLEVMEFKLANRKHKFHYIPRSIKDLTMTESAIQCINHDLEAEWIRNWQIVIHNRLSKETRSVKLYEEKLITCALKSCFRVFSCCTQ